MGGDYEVLLRSNDNIQSETNTDERGMEKIPKSDPATREGGHAKIHDAGGASYRFSSAAGVAF